MELAYFLVISVVAVLAAVAVIASRNTVHSALYMVVNLFCVAMLYLSLSAEFLAVVQITVYAGAIMVLFLFVITMLNPDNEESRSRIRNRLPFAVGFALALLVAVSLAMQPQLLRVAQPAQLQAAGAGNVEAIGGLLFTRYLLPFELVAVLLLVGMVAAIVLGKRRV